MQISAKTWNEYISRLSRLNRKAGQLMQEYIAKNGTADAAALIAYASALVTKYGEGSAELACQMYDALAAAEGALVPAAEPAEVASYSEVARMVNATKASPPQLQSGVSRLVKRAGADTTLRNALRDGAQWAWVPRGDTCAFCITLASRGWQYASEKALKGGHAEHIHANCDCEYAVRFNSSTTVAGYDPEKYLAQYRAAGGDINAMRRIDYAANRERINAQKRAAYAARKQRSTQVLQKLNFAENVPQPVRESVEKELSILPQWQREKAESMIDHVVMTSIEADGSGYHYPTRTLYIHPERSEGDMLHEYGHALEIALDFRHDPRFIRIRDSDIDIEDLSILVYDKVTFTAPVYRLASSKLISEYQGRIYETAEYGVFLKDTMKLDTSLLKEYFSEGFRAYYQEPALLKEKDPMLYAFIEELKNDQK